MNVGNLYGYVCADCDRGTELQVTATVEVLLTYTGTIDATTTPVWNQTSPVDCLNCGWAGTVGDLATVGIKKQSASERVAERFRKDKGTGGP